ncbi:hypothetical protein Tco_0823217 [Tanacetum coccineum]|uniref:Uncharacterized protein n=1 Tax=Tanacetum coccineum TaxID=301880 RepID=A0ABQ5AI89_9ASTR
MALSPSSFRKRYRSSYETPSSSASPAPYPTLPIRKRYRGTSKPILDTKTEDDESEAEGADLRSEESEEEGPDSEGGEAAHEGQQQQAASVEVITMDRPLGLGYGAARQDETPTPRIPAHITWIDPEDGTVYLDIKIDPLSCAPVQTPASPEWSFSSLPVSPAFVTVPSLVASSTTTPTTIIAVDKDEFLKVGAQLELYGSILHDHTQRLDALPPTLLEGHGRDITKLFDRSGVVREEIHSQRFRLGSLERPQE